MSAADWIQTIGIFIAFIGILVAIYFNKKQLKELNRHLRLQFFADYTKRFQEVMLNLPENIMDNDFDIDGLNQEDYSKTMRYLRSYFDLCSEEFDLWKSGNIERRIWMNWEEGIRSKMSNKAFVYAWKKSNYDSYYYPEFSKWMNQIIEGNKPNN
ncbi:hypothetical protein [uncultured Winogradskyella sp.]|uniref:hypothetical protein n=1 Tax=uncultured Winogradskyella sp. TaxID=395353 RepID=UPI0035112895